MIMDVLQTILVSILNGGAFYLPIHITIFVLLPLILRTAHARRYRLNIEPSNAYHNISVIVPEHNESCKVFEECLKSIVENEPLEVIVVLDDGRREIVEIAERYGAKVVALHRRIGKRNSMFIGWRMAKGDIVVHVDSDVILRKNALKEIVKPFNDKLVVSVQGRIHVRRGKSWLAWRLSQFSVHAETISPPTMRAFLKQQLRWIRGGLKAFINEINNGFIVRAPFTYSFLEASYYLGPIAFLAGTFTTAILFASLEKVVLITIAIALLLAFISIALASRALRPYEMTLGTFITSCMLLSLLTYPLTLLSLFTIRRQSSWLTR